MSPLKNKTPNKLKNLLKRASFYAIACIVICVTLLILLVRIGAFGKLPNDLDLKQIKNNTATEVFSVDNKLLGRYYYQNRTNANIVDIPKAFKDALVATEDVRYYKHRGVDFRSTVRVLIKSVILHRDAGGGSTISQQLAKNLFPRKRHGALTMAVAKVREIFIARRIEKLYSKEEILELYLNTVSFGENTFGIETAAITYFNKKPKNLKLEESAMLVGLLKANTSYNPRIHKEAALLRRNVVLDQMVKYDYLDLQIADSLKKTPIILDYRKLTHTRGPAPYMREHLRLKVREILKDAKKPDGSEYNLYADGLKIYTTINANMQFYAEQAVREHLAAVQKIFDRHWKGREPWRKNLNLAMPQIKSSTAYKRLIDRGMNHKQAIKTMRIKHKTTIFDWQNKEKSVEMSSLDSVLHHFKTLQAGFLAMNGYNGDILAWVGGADYKYFQFDHVISKRQVGSTFKPIVYATAMENGVSPCQLYANDSVVYEEYDNWTPVNSDGKYGGFYSVKGALANSVNTVSVKLLLEKGIDSVIHLAKAMGINAELPEFPSLALGTGEVSLYEMVQAYSVILNRGQKIEPRIIRRIEDAQGNIIYTDPAHGPGGQVLSKDAANKVLAMMQGTVDRGTAKSLRTTYGFTSEFAGKTGTTQNHSDGWFIGMSPTIVVGAWVGGDSPVVRFRNLTYGQGGYTALPIYAKFFSKLYRDPVYKYLKAASFNIPQKVQEELDCEDFSDKGEGIVFDISKIKETGVGEFIKGIFGRKKRNKKRNARHGYDKDTLGQ